MKKKDKEHLYAILPVIFAFLFGLAIGYQNQDWYWLAKYSRQSEEFKRAVSAYKQSRDFDNSMLSFEVQCHFDALMKYLEMKDYAKKLERKLKSK